MNVKQKHGLLSCFHAMKLNFGQLVMSACISFFLLLVFFTNNLQAQDLTVIKGVITSEKGELLSGVTVQVKNS